MNVLFLSRSVKGDNRDKLTYNFIIKEMKSLINKGDQLFFLSTKLEKHAVINHIQCLAMAELLETDRKSRIFYTILYLIKNINFFIFFILFDLKKTYHICKIERVIEKIITEHRIDIIHTHFFYPLGENAILSAKKTHTPVVATIRGAEVCDRPDLNYGSLRDVYFKKMARKTLNQVHHITCPNRYIATHIKTLSNIRGSNVSYLPNGIETKSFSILSEPSKYDVAHLKLIAVGRLIQLKNYDFLIESLKDYKKDAFDLTIVGIGYQSDKLKSLIKKNKLYNMNVVEEVPKEELFGMIAGNDFFVHPSLTEGMPNVVLESLSLGVPVLASNIPAHEDIIKDGYNGFLFDPLDKESLKAKILFIQEGKLDYKRMQNNCIESVKNFTIEKKIQGYRALYKKLISNKN